MANDITEQNYTMEDVSFSDERPKILFARDITAPKDFLVKSFLGKKATAQGSRAEWEITDEFSTLIMSEWAFKPKGKFTAMGIVGKKIRLTPSGTKLLLEVLE